jgi:WhiB family redox-sensing transcriptional regulator
MTKNPVWQDQAACRQASPELFFPLGKTGQALTDIEAAKAICALCPVQSQCLAFALNTNQEFGIWGGTTEDERRRLTQLARSRRARHAVPSPS